MSVAADVTEFCVRAAGDDSAAVIVEELDNFGRLVIRGRSDRGV